MIENDKTELNDDIDSLTVDKGIITTKTLQVGEKVDIVFDNSNKVHFTYISEDHGFATITVSINLSQSSIYVYELHVMENSISEKINQLLTR